MQSGPLAPRLPKRHLPRGHPGPRLRDDQAGGSEPLVGDHHFCGLRWPAPRGCASVTADHIPRRSASTSPTNAWATCLPTVPSSGPARMLDDAMGRLGGGTTGASIIDTLRPSRPGSTPVNWNATAPYNEAIMARWGHGRLPPATSRRDQRPTRRFGQSHRHCA